jgi:epoxyqueuosine reductase
MDPQPPAPTVDAAALRALAAAHGFDHVRIAALTPGLGAPHAQAFNAWLDAGHDADMGWLRSTAAVRADPHARDATMRSAVVLAVDHPHRAPPDPGGLTGRVARYAWGRDYHNLIGKRLKRLAAALRAQGVRCWGGTDTAPILERSWATAAGLGFNGKNAVQILPARGSWLLLATLFVDVPLAPDAPLRDHCGRCQRCLVGCPTDAFTGPRVLDARRCIAYWTIEARGLPPRALRAGFGRWVFGCDVCQEVCPHNAAPPDDADAAAAFTPRHAWLDLPELLATPDEALMERFLGTPLRRPGASGLKRNALLALANLGHPDALPAVEGALAHPAPVVRAAAVWALHALGAPVPASFRDDDAEVAAELAAARVSSA